MGKAPIALLSEDDMDSIFGPDQNHTTIAGIALADGRQVSVSGVFARDSVRAAVGRPGASTWASTYTFATHWCEDVAEGDVVQIENQDHEVKSVGTTSAGTTTLKLRRITS